jgi:hypothetical protein
MPLLLFALHGSATAPVALAILDGAAPAVITAASLLTIAISLLYIGLLARAVCVSTPRGVELPDGGGSSGPERGPRDRCGSERAMSG